MNRLIIQRGFSLIELMIAMVIGLLLTSAVAVLFMQSRNNFTKDDQVAEVQENARFAMYIISQDLMMADFWGGLMTSSDVTVDAGVNVNSDCGTGSNSGNKVATAIRYEQPVDFATANANFPCIGFTAANFMAGPGILAVKRTRGDTTPEAALLNNKIYLRSNSSRADLYVKSGATPALPVGYADWEYVYNVYYVKNKTLMRHTLDASGTMVSETLADGVVGFHILFGIDSDTTPDGVANYMTSTPSATEIEQAVSAKIYLLATSTKTIPDYKLTKDFNLGDVTYSVNNDNRYYRLYNTTIYLRNPASVRGLSNILVIS